MLSLLGLLLAAVVSNGGTDGQRVATQDSMHGERSMMKQAMASVSALANVVTPVPATNTSGDKTAEPTPAGVIWVHLSKAYLADYVERNVDHNKPAREDVLGIVFTGASRTTGKTHLVLHPDDREAAAEVEFSGTVHSSTIGHSGPATLQYASESNFHARKQVLFGENGVSTSAATVDAPTRLTPTNIVTSLPGLRGRIGDRIARSREAGSRSQAEAIVGRNTANDIRHDFDGKLDEAVAQIQRKVQAQIAALKLYGEDGHVVLRSRSTPEFIEVAVCRLGTAAEQLQLAAATPFASNPDCSVCVHRNILPTLLANAALRETVAPMLVSATAIGSGRGQQNESKLSMSGDWIAIDMASGGQQAQIPSRVAAMESLTRQ